jgi:hypothetical protein
MQSLMPPVDKRYDGRPLVDTLQSEQSALDESPERDVCCATRARDGRSPITVTGNETLGSCERMSTGVVRAPLADDDVVVGLDTPCQLSSVHVQSRLAEVEQFGVKFSETYLVELPERYEQIEFSDDSLPLVKDSRAKHVPGRGSKVNLNETHCDRRRFLRMLLDITDTDMEYSNAIRAVDYAKWDRLLADRCEGYRFLAPSAMMAEAEQFVRSKCRKAQRHNADLVVWMNHKNLRGKPATESDKFMKYPEVVVDFGGQPTTIPLGHHRSFIYDRSIEECVYDSPFLTSLRRNLARLADAQSREDYEAVEAVVNQHSQHFGVKLPGRQERRATYDKARVVAACMALLRCTIPVSADSAGKPIMIRAKAAEDTVVRVSSDHSHHANLMRLIFLRSHAVSLLHILDPRAARSAPDINGDAIGRVPLLHQTSGLVVTGANAIKLMWLRLHGDESQNRQRAAKTRLELQRDGIEPNPGMPKYAERHLNAFEGLGLPKSGRFGIKALVAAADTYFDAATQCDNPDEAMRELMWMMDCISEVKFTGVTIRCKMNGYAQRANSLDGSDPADALLVAGPPTVADVAASEPVGLAADETVASLFACYKAVPPGPARVSKYNFPAWFSDRTESEEEDCRVLCLVVAVEVTQQLHNIQVEVSLHQCRHDPLFGTRSSLDRMYAASFDTACWGEVEQEVSTVDTSEPSKAELIACVANIESVYSDMHDDLCYFDESHFTRETRERNRLEYDIQTMCRQAVRVQRALDRVLIAMFEGFDERSWDGEVSVESGCAPDDGEWQRLEYWVVRRREFGEMKETIVAPDLATDLIMLMQLTHHAVALGFVNRGKAVNDLTDDSVHTPKEINTLIKRYRKYRVTQQVDRLIFGRKDMTVGNWTYKHGFELLSEDITEAIDSVRAELRLVSDRLARCGVIDWLQLDPWIAETGPSDDDRAFEIHLTKLMIRESEGSLAEDVRIKALSNVKLTCASSHATVNAYAQVWKFGHSYRAVEPASLLWKASEKPSVRHAAFNRLFGRERKLLASPFGEGRSTLVFSEENINLNILREMGNFTERDVTAVMTAKGAVGRVKHVNERFGQLMVERIRNLLPTWWCAHRAQGLNTNVAGRNAFVHLNQDPVEIKSGVFSGTNQVPTA